MKYSLGLDIGVTSIGWAIIDLDNKRIHDLGVRIFERAEDPQTGASLNEPRRTARSARRRLRRRRQRLNNLEQFFIDNKILTRYQIKEILNPISEYNRLNVYELRDRALQDRLSPEELFKAMYQIAKRRGFKSNRKVQEEADAEAGRVTKALHANEALLKAGGHQTVGQALANDARYTVHKRNKRDDYSNSFARTDFLIELNRIIDTQHDYALKNVSNDKIRTLIFGMHDNELTNVNAIMYQRPFMTRELIEKMVGSCTFEKNEKRAPRASYSFELFRLASSLAHLEYTLKDRATRKNSGLKLTAEQIQNVVVAAKKGGKLTYKKVRQTAGISDDYITKPSHIRGKITEDDPQGEENDFGNFKAYHDIRLALKKLPGDWTKADNEETLNKIAHILTVEKADEDIAAALAPLDISQDAKNALLAIKPTNFKAFGHLSTKALQKITPYILQGITYDKACEAVGYDFRLKANNLEQITNPVVRRSIAQVTKIVKALERKYGSPYFIRVETARDLAKNFQDRKSIEQDQKENQARNTTILEKIKEHGITAPTGRQIIKFKLYNEQNGKSLYTGAPMDLLKLLTDDNAYQIDHIIPFSRSGNDGLANKTLVTTTENQQKANKTPFEAFGGDPVAWSQFVANVEATYRTRPVSEGDKRTKRNNYKFNGYAFKKKANLLNQNYVNDEWSARALNDTRYITKFIQNYLRTTVNFAPGNHKQRVFTPTGAITSYMRKRWGLAKIREQDVLHHAADAALVAAMGQGIILQANLYAKRGEIMNALQQLPSLESKIDLLTGEVLSDETITKEEYRAAAHVVLSKKHFPEPWERFREEIDWRTRVLSTEELRGKMQSFDSYDNAFVSNLQPIFVSRMPNRKAKGSAHKETLRSAKVTENGLRTTRTQLVNVKLSTLEDSPVKDTDPQLYVALRQRLLENNNDPSKAFADPVFKLSKDGTPAHQVRAIKVATKQPSGFYINDGKAFVNNGSMVRLDVYQKSNAKGKTEHFFVPVYTHQIPLEKNGQQITKIFPEPKGFTDIDGSFTKVCSLFTNDYVRFYFGNKIEEGYYKSYNVANGQMGLLFHADASQENINLKNKRSAVSVERFDISVLGDNIPRI